MKLYVKILLSFLLVFLVAEIMIFGLFVITAGRIFHSRVERFTYGKIRVAKAFLEEKIQSSPRAPLEQNEALKTAVRFLAEAHNAKIWIERQDGRVAIQSFAGSIPQRIAGKKAGVPKKDAVDFHWGKRHHTYYARAAIEVAGENNSLHVLFERWDDETHRHYFGLGLLSIGTVIALLVVPVSRRITGPLKKLRESALRIADGDLAHRADVSGKDEIGELGRSFNTMAGKVERIVRGGKELTANVSHELRSPLARINIAVELVSERVEKYGGDKIDTHMKNIRDDIEELDRLIDRILELSKYDLREQPLMREKVDLAKLMAELLERHRPAIDRKRLRLETDFSSGEPFPADPEALRVALGNILDNAVKFTPESGHIHTTIRFETNGVAVAVTNSAPRINETDLEMIFEPFHRVPENSAGGSGLGLAITQKAIGEHGGTVRAFNSDRGLTVEIFLPAVWDSHETNWRSFQRSAGEH